MRSPGLLGGLLGLGLITGLVVVAINSRPDQGLVYTVAQVQVHLAHEPRVWVGRTVQVRGIVEPCPGYALVYGFRHCFRAGQPVLTEPAGAGWSTPLPLVAAATDPLVVWVRTLPLAHTLWPSPQRVGWATLTTYRVRLEPRPAVACGDVPCYEALLLDAAPGSL